MTGRRLISPSASLGPRLLIFSSISRTNRTNQDRELWLPSLPWYLAVEPAQADPGRRSANTVHGLSEDPNLGALDEYTKGSTSLDLTLPCCSWLVLSSNSMRRESLPRFRCPTLPFHHKRRYISQRDADAHIPMSNPPLDTFIVPASLHHTAYTSPGSSTGPVDQKHFPSAGG